jgi:xanthine dehydrogenase small subunit
MEKRKKIITKINHERIEIEGEKAFMPLAQFLREEIMLTGTKVVCAEGDCGACTVLLANSVGSDHKLLFKSVNSCILPLYLIDGAQVITVEGIQKSETELHPVQEAMVACQGSQCGYCTPGFICAMTGMVEKLKSENKTVTEKRAKNFLTGNLCRCTGYRPILEAATSLDLEKADLMKDRYHDPSWIAHMKAVKADSMVMNLDHKKIFLPATLSEALEMKSNDPHLKVVAGSTDVGVVVNKGKMQTPKTMALYHIDELKKISLDEGFINVGSTVTLSEFEDYIATYVPELKKILHIFASPQIKNQATLIGNVVNASPIADTIPFLMAMDARVVLASARGVRESVLKDFYLGYKSLDLKADELVTAIKIPRLKPSEKIKLYKVSLRKDLDISAATFAGVVEVDSGKIKSMRVALGGVGPIVMRLTQIEQDSIGLDFTSNTFEEIAQNLPQYISPISDLRASKEYRLLVSQNFMRKFYFELSNGVSV